VVLRTSTPVLKESRMERRGATRYRLQLAVTFSWKDESGVVHGSEGQSRDLNSRGIYVHSSTVPPVGAPVEMNVLLTRFESMKRPAELHAQGRVVRIQSGGSDPERPGFAAMNHTAILRDAEGRRLTRQDPWSEFGLGESKE
jgi:hypothetical protein